MKEDQKKILLSGFKREGCLYIPEIYTKENKQGLLQDYGLGYAIPYSDLFGSKLDIEDIRNEFLKFETKALQEFLCYLSKMAGREGLGTLKGDNVQADVLKDAVSEGIKRGLKVINIDLSELNCGASLCIEAIDLASLINIEIAFECRGTLKPMDNKGTIALCLLALNDHLYLSPFDNESEKEEEFHYEHLRSLWLKSPFYGIAKTYLRRVHRLYSIAQSTMNSIGMEFADRIREYIGQKFNIEYEDYYEFVIAVSSDWLGGRKNSVPIINCLPPDKLTHKKLVPFLDTISLPYEEYQKKLIEYKKKYNNKYYYQPELVKLRADYPYIRFEEYKYLLLGPHFLLNQAELALDSAYLDMKQDEDKPSSLRGALGNCVEDYTREIIQECVTKSSGKKEGMIETNSQVGDLIILNPDISIAFEIKYSRPPLMKAFRPNQESLREFIKWFHETFLMSQEEADKIKTKDTPGALYQVIRDCKLLLEGALSIKPKRVLPVIVVPNDVIFYYGFYSIIDSKLKEMDLRGYEGRIIAPLLISICDIEYIYGLNYGEKGMSFSELLINKAEHSSGRNTTWSKYLKENGLDMSVPDEFLRTLERIVERAGKKLWPEKNIKKDLKR